MLRVDKFISWRSNVTMKLGSIASGIMTNRIGDTAYYMNEALVIVDYLGKSCGTYTSRRERV